MTSIYPFLAYAIVHKASPLMSSRKILEEAFIPDIEANFFLVPLNDIKNYVFSMFIEKITQVLKIRSTFFGKNSENDLQTQANFFGEI